MACQLEIPFFSDVIDFELTTTGFVLEVFAVVGAEIGREQESVRTIETQQMRERTMHFASDEKIVDAKRLLGERMGERMVYDGHAYSAIEEYAGCKGVEAGAPREGIATFDVAQGREA